MEAKNGSSMQTDNKKSSMYGTVNLEQPPPTPPPKHRPTPPPKHSLLGIAFILAGSFSFSVMFLLVKLMAGEASTFTLVFYRSLVQIAISLFICIREGMNPLGPPSFHTRFYLVVRGLFGAAAVCAWFFGITILPLPDAVTLQFTTPPFAAAFAVCMVGEKWLPLDMIGAAVCLTGVALIAHPTWLFGTPAEAVSDDASSSSLLMKTVAVAVTEGGAALAGIAYVAVRKIGNEASAVVMVLYYGALSIPMVMLGQRLFEGTWNIFGDLTTFTVKDIFLLLLMGIAGYGGQWLTNLGLQNETAATATLATSTQIVWTYVFELMFLHEALNPWSVAGTGLIMGYVLVVAAMKMIGSSVPVPAATEEGESQETALLLSDEMIKLEGQPEHGKQT